MEPKLVITIILSILGGLATNAIYIFVFKHLFTDLYENILRTYGVRGLKFRSAIAILLIDLPGLITGLSTKALAENDLILASICASSAFFALIMLFRNLPKSGSEQLNQ